MIKTLQPIIKHGILNITFINMRRDFSYRWSVWTFNKIIINSIKLLLHSSLCEFHSWSEQTLGSTLCWSCNARISWTLVSLLCNAHLVDQTLSLSFILCTKSRSLSHLLSGGWILSEKLKTIGSAFSLCSLIGCKEKNVLGKCLDTVLQWNNSVYWWLTHKHQPQSNMNLLLYSDWLFEAAAVIGLGCHSHTTGKGLIWIVFIKFHNPNLVVIHYSRFSIL